MNEPVTDSADRNLPPNHIKWMAAGFFVLAVIVAVALQSMNEHKVSLKSKTLQIGFYKAENCSVEAGSHINDCMCEADIKTVLIDASSKKITKAIQTVIDANTPSSTQQEGGLVTYCSGVRVGFKPDNNEIINDRQFKWRRIYESPEVLTMKYDAYYFGAGAAHGIYSEEGFTFDKTTGDLISPLADLDESSLQRANDFIQEAFNTKFKEVVFEETITKPSNYLTRAGCDGCTLYYVEGGWRVVFQLYSVAPYVAGMIDIILPQEIFPKAETMIQST